MNSEISESHFFALPREIRDIIYSYLHRTLELRGIKRIGQSPVFVRLENAPYASIYRANQRLRAEYQESGPSKNLSALIFGRACEYKESFWSDEAEVIFRDEIALELVKSVTVRVWLRGESYKTTTPELINDPSCKIAELRLLRVFQIVPIYFCTHETFPEELEWATRNRIEPLPDVMVSLPRTQIIDCREVKTVNLQELGQAPSQIHTVWQYRAHLYSLDSSAHMLRTRQETLKYLSCPDGFREWCEQRNNEPSLKRKPITSSRVLVWKEEHPTPQLAGEHETT